jgi:hypothetical protein
MQIQINTMIGFSPWDAETKIAFKRHVIAVAIFLRQQRV